MVRFGSVNVEGDSELALPRGPLVGNGRIKKKDKANMKKKWVDRRLLGRVSLVLALAAFIKWGGTPYDSDSIDDNRGTALSMQPRRWHQRQQPQDHRRVKTSTTSSKSLPEAIATLMTSSSPYKRAIMLQFSLGKVVPSDAGTEDDDDRVQLFRDVENALLRILCQRASDEDAASAVIAPLAIVSGDTTENAGTDVCAQWRGRHNNNARRSLRQGLEKQRRRQRQDGDGNEGAIPAPNVFALFNGTDDVNDADEGTREEEEAVGSAAFSTYSSDDTVLKGRVSMWRLQETLLPLGDDGDASVVHTPTKDPYYYKVWTVHYPVLQLGDYYWEQMQQQIQDNKELEDGANEEHLAVYTYDNDDSEQEVAGGNAENRTGAAIALDLLRRELQDRVNVAIRSEDFDGFLRQGHVNTYRASVVGMEPVTFATGSGAGTSTSTNDGTWTSRQIALAVLYGLVGLIAVAATVLVGWYVRRTCVSRRSQKKKMTKTMSTKAAKTKDNAGGSTYDSTAGPNEKAGDGRSITSGSSFLDADHDDDPGGCWIPIPNVIRAPTPSSSTVSMSIVDDASRGWLHSQDGDYPDSCHDPLMVLMETDDDDDDSTAENRMDSLDEEASLVTTFTAASVTTVEVDVDTCQVVNPGPPKRVRFDPSLWVADTPNLHHLGRCENFSEDAGSVSSLSDAAGTTSMDRLEVQPSLPRIDSTVDGNTVANTVEVRQCEDPPPTPPCTSPAVESIPQPNAGDSMVALVQNDSVPVQATKEVCPMKAAETVKQGDVAAGGLGDVVVGEHCEQRPNDPLHDVAN